MKNWRNLGVLLFLSILTACAPGLAGRTDLPLVQATSSGDVKVTYDRDKITYSSTRYGIEFSVPTNFRIWAEDFGFGKDNILGDPFPSMFGSWGGAFVLITEGDGCGNGFRIEDYPTLEAAKGETLSWFWAHYSRHGSVQDAMNGVKTSEVTVDGVKVLRTPYEFGRRQAQVAIMPVREKFYWVLAFNYGCYQDTGSDMSRFLATLRFVKK